MIALPPGWLAGPLHVVQVLRVLLCLGAALSAQVRSVQADEWGTHGATGTAIYSNNDGLRVVSPWLEASQRVWGPAALRAHAKTDFITAASVDMVSGATPRFDEVRKEVGAQAQWDDNGTVGHAGYTYSTENDTHSHTLVLGGSRDWLSRNLTTSLAYGLTMDRLGSVREPEGLWRDRTSHRLDASVSQLLSKTALVGGTFTLELIDGFQSSPYRKVPLVPRDSAGWLQSNALWVAERHPDARVRHGLSLEGRQALSRSWFLRVAWRGYLDTWAVRSHTGEVGLTWEVARGLELELSDRLYWQSRASFERTMYSVDRDYITRDRRLSGQLSNSAGLHVRLRWGAVEALLQGLGSWTRYDDFRTLVAGRFVPMPDTWASTLQAALSVDL